MDTPRCFAVNIPSFILKIINQVTVRVILKQRNSCVQMVLYEVVYLDSTTNIYTI